MVSFAAWTTAVFGTKNGAQVVVFIERDSLFSGRYHHERNTVATPLHRVHGLLVTKPFTKKHSSLGLRSAGEHLHSAPQQASDKSL